MCQGLDENDQPVRTSHESVGQRRKSTFRELELLGSGHTAQETSEILFPVSPLCALPQLLPRLTGLQGSTPPGLREPAGRPSGLTDTPWPWADKEGVCPTCRGGPTGPAWAQGSWPGPDESVRSLGHPSSLSDLTAVTQPCLTQTSSSRGPQK